MSSREQSAEAHPTMSRGKRSLQLTPGPLTSTPHGRQGERDDPHDGDDAAAPRLPVYVRYRALEAAGWSETWIILTRPSPSTNFPRE
jgi:hypothetical protein